MLFYFHPGDVPFWMVFLWVIVIPGAIVALGVWGLLKLGVGEPPRSHGEKVSPLLSALREAEDETNSDSGIRSD